MPHLNVHCVRALPFHYFRGVWEKMQEPGPKGASATFSRSSASMAAAFGSAGSSCSHPSLLGGCFRDSFCPSMFASRTNLTCQEMHIFFGMFFTSCTMSLGQDNSCSYCGLGPLEGGPFSSYLSKGEGKPRFFSLKQCLFILFCDV